MVRPVNRQRPSSAPGGRRRAAGPSCLGLGQLDMYFATNAEYTEADRGGPNASRTPQELCPRPWRNIDVRSRLTRSAKEGCAPGSRRNVIRTSVTWAQVSRGRVGTPMAAPPVRGRLGRHRTGRGVRPGRRAAAAGSNRPWVRRVTSQSGNPRSGEKTASSWPWPHAPGPRSSAACLAWPAASEEQKQALRCAVSCARDAVVQGLSPSPPPALVKHWLPADPGPPCQSRATSMVVTGRKVVDRSYGERWPAPRLLVLNRPPTPLNTMDTLGGFFVTFHAPPHRGPPTDTPQTKMTARRTSHTGKIFY